MEDLLRINDRTATDAIVTLEDGGDLVSAEPLVVRGVDEENDLLDVLVLHRPRGRFRVIVLVVGTAVDPENTAQSLNVVLESEFVNRL